MQRTSCITIMAVVAAGVLASRAARADVTVLDNHKTIDVDCAKDPNVNLVGNHLTVTTRGVCTSIIVAGNEETITGSAATVRVAGNHNTLELDAADEVSITGNDNAITVHKPIKAKTTRISNPGSRNKVTRAK